MSDGEYLEDFVCPDFVSTCLKFVEGYFQQKHYHLEMARSHRIRFSKDDTFVDFSHYPEDCPRYNLMVAVGILGDRCPGIEEKVPSWWLESEAKIASDYKATEFTNAEQLETVLVNFVPNTLVPLIEPLMKDKSRLRQAIDKFKKWTDENVR